MLTMKKNHASDSRGLTVIVEDAIENTLLHEVTRIFAPKEDYYWFDIARTIVRRHEAARRAA